jgi:hypothetical protein
VLRIQIDFKKDGIQLFMPIFESGSWSDFAITKVEFLQEILSYVGKKNYVDSKAFVKY